MVKIKILLIVLIDLSFFILKSHCYTGAFATNTDAGYCVVTNGILIPVGDYAIDNDRCERISCEPGEIRTSGCSPMHIYQRVGMECELIRRGDNYPDCCPTKITCRRTYDWPPVLKSPRIPPTLKLPPLPILADDNENNFTRFSPNNESVNITPSEEISNETNRPNSNFMSTLPTFMFASHYNEDNITDFTHTEQASNATLYEEIVSQVNRQNANHSENSELKSRSQPSFEYVPIPLPVLSMANHKENNLRDFSLTKSLLLTTSDKGHVSEMNKQNTNRSFSESKFKYRSPPPATTPLPLTPMSASMPLYNTEINLGNVSLPKRLLLTTLYEGLASEINKQNTNHSFSESEFKSRSPPPTPLPFRPISLPPYNTETNLRNVSLTEELLNATLVKINNLRAEVSSDKEEFSTEQFLNVTPIDELLSQINNFAND